MPSVTGRRAIDDSAYVHPDAVVIGAVTIGPKSSVWPGAVLRGDYGEITRRRPHLDPGRHRHPRHGRSPDPDRRRLCRLVTIAHLEGCTVEDGALVGSGSVVLHRAVVRTGALVGAGAVVPNDIEVPSARDGARRPRQDQARRRRRRACIQIAVDLYVENAARYKTDLRRLD